MSLESPWRAPDFRVLFSAVVLTNLGTNAAYVTVPLIAVEALDAGPGVVGALLTLMSAAFLLIGLPAGAWVDRTRHRRVLVAAEAVRALLFLSVPLAWWLDALTLWQLGAVVTLAGAAAVFFDVTTHSALPRLVGRDALVRANSSFVVVQAVGQMAGRGAGGGLVQLLTAPVAAVALGLFHLASALRLTALGPSPKPAPPAPGVRLAAQIREGLRHVLADGRLRALVLAGAISNLGLQIVNTLIPVLFVGELGLSAGTLGLYWAVGGIGALIGARCARTLAARSRDHVRTLALTGLCLSPAPLALPLVDRGGWLALAAFGWAVVTFKIGIDNVLAVTVRQRLTPDTMLGRMNATFRFLLFGAISLGSAVAGILGELVGVREAMWAGAALMTVAWVPLLLVRRRAGAAGEPGPAAAGAADAGLAGPAAPGGPTGPVAGERGPAVPGAAVVELTGPAAPGAAVVEPAGPAAGAAVDPTLPVDAAAVDPAVPAAGDGSVPSPPPEPVDPMPAAGHADRARRS
ncbi:MFS transporter [Streptomyces yaizuensis]|uniref:MFS transporter n=1 Tax=Streptomyces yaizuensis TaxID=2989713 RepID=A0ABQ5P474_9ACTN|nr:MFS transporter [Streptomyces sp. YSPA8]GLF97360.1 MFS transporter [Streptomyces sp. YSPA8]